jgi:hypothetical protein
MWSKVAEEMQIPWRAAEAMHWQMGEQEMARRASCQPFVLNGGHRSRHAAHTYGVRDQQGSQRIDRDRPAYEDHYPPSEHSLETVDGLIDVDTFQEDRGGRPTAADKNADFNRNGAKRWPLFESRPRGVCDVEIGPENDGDEIFDKRMRCMKELLVQLQKMWTTTGGVLVAALWMSNIAGGIAFAVAKNNSGYEFYENWYVDEGGKRSSFD